MLVVERGAMEPGHSLALAFDTPGADFMRGVEVGRLWEQLKGEAAVEQELHVSNAEMVLRLAEATGRRVRVSELDDTWMLATFEAPRWAAERIRPLDDPQCDGC